MGVCHRLVLFTALWLLSCCLLAHGGTPVLSADEKLMFVIKKDCNLGGKFSNWPVPDGLGVCSLVSMPSMVLAVNCDSKHNIIDLQFGSLGDSPQYRCLTSALGKFSRLRSLNFTRSTFTGILPPEWGNLRNLQASLQTLSLWDQFIKGGMPSTWAKLRNLRYLQISGRDCCLNKFTGKLPAAWRDLTKLEFLNLAFAQITSTLPPQWSTLTKLKTLNLSVNKLQGTIPPSWSNMKSLKELLVYSYGPSQLCGAIPKSLQRAVQGYDGKAKCK